MTISRESTRGLQHHLPGLAPYEDALRALEQAGTEVRGAVFTRREVVEFILDLTGYTADKPLHTVRLLEPSCGDGNFLQVAVERLLHAWWDSPDRTSDPVTDLADSLTAVELHTETISQTRRQLADLLRTAGLSGAEIEALLNRWLVQGDFLLVPLEGPYDYVVGNPPYVRQESIPDALIAEYRRRYRTIYDRADLYIPFLERSLFLLKEGGSLGFICADRWMKNRYGGPLRELVSHNYHLRFYVDMFDTPAFHGDVIAYPAITVIANETPGATRIACRPAIDRQALRTLATDMTAPSLGAECPVKELAAVTAGADPWILESSDQLALVRRLERDLPLIEDAGCRVGIGVATGADRAFIGPLDELDVEPDRKLPLATTRDIASGHVKWRGRGVINPFAEDGSLVNLDNYPLLRQYLEKRYELISRRHVARRDPRRWYRTIDRIYPALAREAKLLIPDIKGAANIVYEEGRLYPHHNLYYITSDAWDLKALQAVLLSGIARLFVSIYSTQMRGGYLRFQAQYLRRIRLPRWQDVPADTKDDLVAAAKRGDVAACNEAAFRLYRLAPEERAALGGNGEG